MHLFRRNTAHGGTQPAAAMTTPFYFPCGKKFYDFSGKNDLYFNPACAPPNFIDYWWSSVGYYSPALCPSGYTIGCERWHFEQGPTVEPTETAMMCVPYGYACGQNPSYATSATDKAVMIQIRWASTDLPALETPPMTRPPPVTIPRVNLPEQTATWKFLDERQDAPGSFGGSFQPEPTQPLSTARSISSSLGFPVGPSPTDTIPGVDTALTTPSLASAGPSSSSSGPSSSGPSDSGAGNKTDNGVGGGRAGLSTGEQAGIGVGVGLGVPLLLGLAAFLFWKYGRHRPGAADGMPTSQVEQYTGMAEMEGWPGAMAGGIGAAAPPPAEADKAIHPMAGYQQQHQPLAELDIVRAEPYPAELSLQERAYEAEAAPRPVPELQGQPYMQQPFDPQQQVPEHQYYHPQAAEMPRSGHNASLPPVAAAATGGMVGAYIAHEQVQAPPPTVSTVSPVYSGPPSEVISPASLNSAALGAVSGPSPSHPEIVGQGGQDLEQLRQQHAELESRRQRLLQLQEIEQQQAALRTRIAAAEGVGQTPAGPSGPPTSGSG